MWRERNTLGAGSRPESDHAGQWERSLPCPISGRMREPLAWPGRESCWKGESSCKGFR
jgi:hypothetical protein